MKKKHNVILQVILSCFKRFMIAFCTISAKCGGVRYANSTPSSLTSPDYPNDYPHNSRCRWVIDAPANEQVYVVLEDVALEGNIACAYDYLELRDNPLVSSLFYPLMLNP